jgi:hypothetical protein
MSLVSNDQARKEFEEFLNEKKISPSKRKTNESATEELIEALSEGNFIISPDKCTMKLRFPIESGDFPIQELHLKKRITAGDVHPFLKHVMPQDIDGRYQAYMCALSGQSLNVVRKLESGDYDLLRSYVAFFI